MRKKTIAFLLAIVCMLSFSVAAFAATPSKTTSDMSQASVPSDVNAPNFNVKIVGNTPAVADLIKALGGKSPAAYFGSGAISALLPAGVSASNMVCNEFVTVSVTGYVSELGAVTIAFSFPTAYKDGQALVAMIGVFAGSGSGVTWHAVPAKVVAGTVHVTFPAAVLEKLNGNVGAFAILNAK